MKPIEGGTKRLERKTHPTMLDAVHWVGNRLANPAPSGNFVPWRVKLQRSSRGLRTTATIVWASAEWIEAGARERQERRRGL